MHQKASNKNINGKEGKNRQTCERVNKKGKEGRKRKNSKGKESNIFYPEIML
jgi:hypothetical protein